MILTSQDSLSGLNLQSLKDESVNDVQANKKERLMSPDVSAQIIAKAGSDDNFAQALRGPDAYAAIQDALGVSLPAGSPLPEIPPAPEGWEEGLGVRTAARAGACFFCTPFTRACGFSDATPC